MCSQTNEHTGNGKLQSLRSLKKSIGKLIYLWVMEIRDHAKEALFSLRFSCLSKIHSAAVVILELKKLSVAHPIPTAVSGIYMPG